MCQLYNSSQQGRQYLTTIDMMTSTKEGQYLLWKIFSWQPHVEKRSQQYNTRRRNSGWRLERQLYPDRPHYPTRYMLARASLDHCQISLSQPKQVQSKPIPGHLQICKHPNPMELQ